LECLSLLRAARLNVPRVFASELALHCHHLGCAFAKCSAAAASSLLTSTAVCFVVFRRTDEYANRKSKNGPAALLHSRVPSAVTEVRNSDGQLANKQYCYALGNTVSGNGTQQARVANY
jgi:hypothetical protein